MTLHWTTLLALGLRFAKAAFRRCGFFKCHGAGIASNCTVPRELDAAHREGRDRGTDGFFLREDIHALYDAQTSRLSTTAWR